MNVLQGKLVRSLENQKWTTSGGPRGTAVTAVRQVCMPEQSYGLPFSKSLLLRRWRLETNLAARAYAWYFGDRACHLDCLQSNLCSVNETVI